LHWASSTEWISAKTTAGKPEQAIAISAKTASIKSGHVIAVFQQKNNGRQRYMQVPRRASARTEQRRGKLT
jgi:hypothetical protein